MVKKNLNKKPVSLKKKIFRGFISFFVIIMVLSLSSFIVIEIQDNSFEKDLQSQNERDLFTIQEIKDDIIAFQELFGRVHPSTIPSFPFEDISQNLTDLADSINTPISRLEFYRRFSPLVGQIYDEHTYISLPEYELNKYAEDEGTIFPFEVELIEEKLYIANNLSDYSTISAGMEITSINNISSSELISTLKHYFSGTTDIQKCYYMQRDFKEILYLVYEFSDNFELNLTDTITLINQTVIVSGSIMSETDLSPFSYENIGNNTLLFTYNEFYDPNNNFNDFLAEMFSYIKDNNIEKLIIDIRKNQGGASAYGDDILKYLTDKEFYQFVEVETHVSPEIKANFLSYAPSFLRWFPIQYVHPMLKPLWNTKEGENAKYTFDSVVPEANSLRFTGDVHLITSPGSMSSASIFAGAFEHYDLGTIIGGETGGYPRCYGNVITFYLPNTGLKIDLPTSIIYGYGESHVVPDYPVIQTLPDLSLGIDTVLEFSKAL